MTLTALGEIRSHPAPAFPTLHSAYAPSYRWTATHLPSAVFPGFHRRAQPESAEGCNYTSLNNKTKKMRRELHQRANEPAGEKKKKKKSQCGFLEGWGAGFRPEMRVMDALRLNTSKSPPSSRSLAGRVSECVRESVQD